MTENGNSARATPETHGYGPSKRLSEKTLAGIAWTSLLKSAQAILQILAIAILARLLSPNEFGLFAAAMVVGGFCSVFSQLGIGTGIVQRAELEERHVRSGFTLALMLGMIVGAAVWTLADQFASFFGMPDLSKVVRVMAFGFPLISFAAVAESMALRHFRFRWLAKIEAAAFGIGFVVVAPILSLLDLGVMALAGAYLSQQFLRATLLLYGQPHEKRLMLERQAVMQLVNIGLGHSIGKFFNYFATQADNLVVGKWMGAASLGIYGHAYQLMVTPANLIGQAMSQVLFPTMASVQHEKTRLIRAYRTGVFACATIVIPGSALVVIIAPELVLALFGPDWAAVAAPLRVLACAMLFRTSYKISDALARATGAVYRRAVRQIIYAGAIFFGALIGHEWGLAGVAWGVFCALALNFVLMAHLSIKVTGWTWVDFFAAHRSGVALGAVVAGVCYPSVTLLREAGTAAWVIIPAASMIALFTAATIVLAFPRVFLKEEDMSLVTTVSRVSPSWMRPSIQLLERRISN